MLAQAGYVPHMMQFPMSVELTLVAINMRASSQDVWESGPDGPHMWDKPGEI